jgi:hypothetical protein
LAAHTSADANTRTGGVPVANDRTIGDDRVVPNCYYVVAGPFHARASHARRSDEEGSTNRTFSRYGGSSLSGMGKDIVDCVNENSENHGRVEKLLTDGKNARAWVRFQKYEDAVKNLLVIAGCLENKGYEVEIATIEASYEELGVEVPGYTPGSDFSAE